MVDFAEWFAALENEALATVDGKAFNDAFFRLHTTGGGCTAWKRDCENGRYILVTDSGGTDHMLSDAGHALNEGKPDAWLVGMHDDDGNEYPCVEAATVADAIAVADEMDKR